MFIDASAIVAIVTRECEADDLTKRLEDAPRRLTSALAVYEATLAIARKLSWPLPEATRYVERFVVLADAEYVPIGAREAEIALDAFDRFGKGRHPARLNMGDCFAYACARVQGAPMLFKGDDFTKTDIEAA